MYPFKLCSFKWFLGILFVVSPLRVDAAVAAPPHHGRRMLGGGLRRNPSWECSQPRKTEDQATTGEGTASSTLNASAPHRKFSFSIAPSPPPTSIYVNSGMCMIFFITKMVQIWYFECAWFFLWRKWSRSDISWLLICDLSLLIEWY